MLKTSRRGVIELPKGTPKTVITVLEARSGLKCEYESEEARKASVRVGWPVSPSCPEFSSPRRRRREGPASRTLADIKRICVDKIVCEEATVAAARELAIAGLFSARRFVITEKCDKADAILKGRGTGKRRDESSWRGRGHRFRRRSGRGVALLSGDPSERIRGAPPQEGTIVWAYSQDSPGGKVKGAIADAIDRAVKQLLREVERVTAKSGTPDQEALMALMHSQQYR